MIDQELHLTARSRQLRHWKATFTKGGALHCQGIDGIPVDVAVTRPGGTSATGAADRYAYVVPCTSSACRPTVRAPSPQTSSTWWRLR